MFCLYINWQYWNRKQTIVILSLDFGKFLFSELLHFQDFWIISLLQSIKRAHETLFKEKVILFSAGFSNAETEKCNFKTTTFSHSKTVSSYSFFLWYKDLDIYFLKTQSSQPAKFVQENLLFLETGFKLASDS